MEPHGQPETMKFHGEINADSLLERRFGNEGS